MSDLPTYDEAMAIAAEAAERSNAIQTPACGVAYAQRSLAWTALARELREAGAMTTVTDARKPEPMDYHEAKAFVESIERERR